MMKGINDGDIRTIINSSPAIIFLWDVDEDWTVNYVSENILQFGYAVEELMDKKLNYSDIVHPDDIDQLKASFNDYISSDKRIGFTRQYRIITKFGHIRWVDERSLLKRDVNGNVEKIQGVVIDITENKENEAAIKINEMRLETLLKLNRMNENSIKEIIEFALDEGVKLTGSENGYFGLVNQSENIFTLHS